jgi:hypothetical protein
VNLSQYFPRIVAQIQNSIDSRKRVLVHCFQVCFVLQFVVFLKIDWFKIGKITKCGNYCGLFDDENAFGGCTGVGEHKESWSFNQRRFVDYYYHCFCLSYSLT